MNRFLKTTKALLKKDFKDSVRNVSMGILFILPPIIALLFRFATIIDFGSQFILLMTMSMILTMTPLSYLSSIIAEEKEKNTLRTLMLSGVSAMEFLTSKIIVVWVLTQAVSILNIIISGYPLRQFPAMLMILGICSIPLYLIGASIGILSKDQMSTSLIAMPVMLVLLFPVVMEKVVPMFGIVAKFNPIKIMMDIIFLYEKGEFLSMATLQGFGILVVWTILCTALFVITYKRKRLDF